MRTITLKKDFSSSDLNNSLKNLYETNFFSDVKLSIENGTLNIIVVENPIIEDIEVLGIKSKTFTQELVEALSLKNRMSFTENLLSKDLDLIKNILKTNSFYFAKVDSLVSKNEELNSVRLKIEIDRGKKARIEEISFIGDKKIKDKKLIEVIASEEHKFWKFISKKVYLNQSRLELDKRLLTNYYRNLGYHKVKVLNSFAELNDKSFKIVFNIDAGNKYIFNEIN